MKRIITKSFLLVFVASPCLGFCQKAVITTARESNLYRRIPNALDIAVDGYWCKDIIVSTDNGKIEQTDKACRYVIYPEREGKTEINIRERKSTHKFLDKVVFNTKAIPNPVVTVAGKSGGAIAKNVLKVQIGIGALLMNFDFDIHYEIKGYTVIVIRNGQALFVGKYQGGRFPKEVVDVFNSVEPNDKVLFSEVYCKIPDNSTVILQPIEFTILD